MISRKDTERIPQMDKKSNQQKKIIDYIRENGSATIRELFIYCNVNSPSKRISELRKMGLITTERCTRTKPSGENVRFCRYYLKENANAGTIRFT